MHINSCQSNATQMVCHCLSHIQRESLMLMVTASQHSADKRVSDYNHASTLTTGGRCVGDVIHNSAATSTLTCEQQNNSMLVTPVRNNTQRDNSKISHPRCVYINNRCRYQSITQQYLKRCLIKTDQLATYIYYFTLYCSTCFEC